MLISTEKNVVFIHNYKNAGTSITKALSPYGIFQFSPPFEKLGDPAYRHITASDLADLLGMELFKSFFSFAVVRNPWNWQVSLYAFMKRQTNHPQHSIVKGLNFTEYLHWRVNEDLHLQKEFISDRNGEQLVTQVLKFEKLNEEFPKLCRKLGLKARLPRLNLNLDPRPYKDYYRSDRDIELVRSAFREDIKTFGYDGCEPKKEI